MDINVLYLNNSYLTSEQIICRFETEVLNGRESSNINAPSPLQQFKNKLLSIYFNELSDVLKNKPKAKTTEEKATLALEKENAIREALSTHPGFSDGYPHLKQVLSTIFLSNDLSDKAVILDELKTCSLNLEQNARDWHAEREGVEFQTLETKYGYFSSVPLEQQQKLHELFIKLSIACHAMIVLFEKNNTPEDTMAYDYAYKLMALYYDPSRPRDPQKEFDVISKKAYKLLSQSDYKQDKPFHDNLIVKLLLPDSKKLFDINGWRAFIEREGSKSFRYFNMAVKLEEKIAEQTQEAPRAPKTEKEAKSMAMLCFYTRAKEDIEFANLCQTHKVDESTFNACLDYMAEPPGWPKKSTDSIPDIQIKGHDTAEGYYWVKLPPSDKRSLILGYITDCCQSINSNSEQCVKDGAGLSDNGFYLLLKQRKKGVFSLIIDGSINESDFNIIGQSYAWKSNTGNLCLDSIECLRDSISLDSLRSLMTSFSRQVLKENETINFINVGQGGKTPKDLFSWAYIKEKISQGYHYGDSSDQYIVEQKHSFIDVKTLDEKFTLSDKGFIKKLQYLSAHFEDKEDFLNQLSILLRENPKIESELTGKRFNAFFELGGSHPKKTLMDLIPFDYEAFEQLDVVEKNKYSVARLIIHCKTGRDLYIALNNIPTDKHNYILSIIQKLNHGLFNSFINEYFNDYKENIFSLIRDENKIRVIYPKLDESYKTIVLNEFKDELINICKNIRDLEVLVYGSNYEQKLILFDFSKENLSVFTKDIFDLTNLLKHFNAEQREEIFEALKNDFPIMLNGEKRVGPLLNLLTSSQIKIVMDSIVIKNLEDISTIISGVDSQKIPVILDSIANNYWHIFMPPDKYYKNKKNYRDWHTLLDSNPSNRDSIFVALKKKVFNEIDNTATFKDIVSGLNHSEKRELLGMSKDKITGLIPSYQRLDDFWSIQFNEEEKLYIFYAIQDHFSTFLDTSISSDTYQPEEHLKFLSEHFENFKLYSLLFYNLLNDLSFEEFQIVYQKTEQFPSQLETKDDALQILSVFFDDPTPYEESVLNKLFHLDNLSVMEIKVALDIILVCKIQKGELTENFLKDNAFINGVLNKDKTSNKVTPLEAIKNNTSIISHSSFFKEEEKSSPQSREDLNTIVEEPKNEHNRT